MAKTPRLERDGNGGLIRGLAVLSSATPVHHDDRKTSFNFPVEPGRHRINRTAAVALVGLIVVAAVLYYPVRLLQSSLLRRSALSQARAMVAKGRVDQALVNLDAYLEQWPEDPPGLSMMGELLADHASSPERVLRGTVVIDQLLRLDGDSPARQDDRRRLVLLYLRLGDMIRAGSDRVAMPFDRFENRYRAAARVAEQRVKLGADDAEAHRLVGLALERLAGVGDSEADANSARAYRKALRRDPGDVASAEHLASARLARKDRAGADQILEDLIRARPRLVEARLARARHFLATGREDRAKSEAESASRLAPGDPGVRLLAAGLALRRDDPVAARRHLEAIPGGSMVGPRAAVLLGQVALAERRPEEALRQWRLGLARTSGTDPELTWRLAEALIRLGRVGEARPLVDQFRRLVGGDEDPMSRFLVGLRKERTGRPVAATAELEPIRDEVAAEWKSELEMTLARCYEAAGDVDRARDACARARDHAPSAAAPRLALARLLRATDPSRAADDLEAATRSNHPEPSLLAELARSRAAQQLVLPADRRDWSAAEAALERGRRVKPDDADLALARAEVLAALGRVDPAIASLEAATRGPARARPEVWLVLAQLLSARGRFGEAMAALGRGESPGMADEPATLRVARARILLGLGRGRDAIALLAVAPGSMPAAGRAELARARAEALGELGDLGGAHASCSEWAELAPDQPGPGLFLLELARKSDDPRSLERGLALLRKAGCDDEPHALAAQALAVLLPGRAGEGEDAAQLDRAESLSQRLNEVAPDLPLTALVRGMMMERGRSFEEAIADYKAALKGDSTGLAMARLVDLLTRLKRLEELDTLRKSPDPGRAVDRLALGSALAAGDKDRAEALLQRLVEAEPESLEFRAARASMLREVGKAGDAEAALRDLVDRHPERPQGWLALLASEVASGDRSAATATIARASTGFRGGRPWLLLARMHWIAGDRAAAARASDDALAAHPDDLPTLRAASELLEAEGRLDRAEALLRHSMKLAPTAPWAPRRLALVLSAGGANSSWAEAWALVGPGGPGAGDSPEDRLIRATVLERSPDPARRAGAVEAYSGLADDLPTAHPAGRAARVRLSRILLASGDFAGSARAIARATGSADEADPSDLALAIEALARSGEPGPARDRLERLEAIEPDSPRSAACRALVLKAEGDGPAAASAIEDAAAASEKLPDGEDRHAFYLEQLARLGLDDAADRLGRRLAELWPRRAWAPARLLAARGRAGDALDACRVAVEAGASREPLGVIAGLDLNGKLDPGQSDRAREVALAVATRSPADPVVLPLAVSILHHQKRLEEEVALYRRALDIDPGNAFARNNLAWALSEDLGRPAEGLAEVDRLIAGAGREPRTGDTRGVILTRLGRPDEAIAELTRVVEAEPTATRLLHLARAFARANRPADQGKALEAALKAGLPPWSLEPGERSALPAP